MDHGAVDLESARDIGLAAENLDQSLRAVNGVKLSVSN